MAVACIFPWYGRAALGAAEGSAWVRGPALYMQALHGGKAKNDQRESHKMAVLLRGGLLPQAYVYPAARRATRDRVRRRTHVRRPRAELLAHGQHTTNQYTRPEMGKKIASKTTRDGVAARFADPAGQKTLEVAWAWSTYDEALLTDLELSIVQTAKQHDAHTFYRLRSIPGVGKILALGVLYARHARHRFPRGPDCVSSCRGVQCARDAAGQRWGTAGKKIGHAHLQGAFSEAAALTILAHTRARAVYYMLTRATGCEMDQFVHGSREQSG